jgi:hypothetical protein
LQVSFIGEPSSAELTSIAEGETLFVERPLNWAIIDSHGLVQQNDTNVFTVGPGHESGLIVITGADYYAIVGQIANRTPTVSNLRIVCDHGLLTTAYDFVGGVEGRSKTVWVKIDQKVVVSLSKSYMPSSADRHCSLRVIVTPATADGRKGKAVASPPFVVEEWLDFESQKVELIPPEAITEEVGCSIDFTGKKEGAESFITCTAKPMKRWHFVWMFQDKVVHEGPRFVPKKEDIGRQLTFKIRDRIREFVIAQIELPVVTCHTPTLRDLKLSVESEGRHRITAIGSYLGGFEGKSVLTWHVQTTTTQTITSGRKWIELDHNFDGAKVWLAYLPVNSDGQAGNPVKSEVVVLRSLGFLKITEATMVVNAQGTHITCQTKSEGRGKIAYRWAYTVRGKLQLTNQNSDTHLIDKNDFKYPLHCILQAFGPDDEPGEERTVDVGQAIIERLAPIVRAAIHAVDRALRPAKTETEFRVGQQLQLVIECQGPPVVSKSIRWERRSDTQEWATVSEGDCYPVVNADQGKQLRALVRITTAAIESIEVVAGPAQIVNDNPIMRRVAGTMKRSGKAVFDAALLTGQPAVIVIEGQPGTATLAIKQGATDTFKSAVRDLAVEAAGECSVELRGRLGYRTEITFSHKKTTGGIGFPPPDARDLFIHVMDAFKDDGQQGTKRKAAPGQKKI